MRLLLYFILLFTHFYALADVPFQKEIDSLKKSLKESYTHTTQIKLYVLVSTSKRHLGQYDESIKIGLKAENLALKANDNNGLIAALSQIGESHRELGQLDKAIEYNKRILQLSKDQNDLISTGNVYDQLGHIYFSQGDTTASLKHHEQALKLRKQSNDLYGIGNSYESIAQVYVAKENYLQAVHYYKLCYTSFSKLESEQAKIASSAANVGLLYSWISNNREAIIYFEKAAKLYEKIHDIDGLTWTYNQIGNLYSIAGNFEKSLVYNSKTLEISRRENLPFAEADAYRHRIDTYILMKRYQEALQLIYRNIQFYKKNNNFTSLIVSYIQLGEIKYGENLIHESLNSFNQALELSIAKNNIYYTAISKEKLGNTYFHLKQYNLAIDNLLQAVEYFEKIQEVNILSSSYLTIAQSYNAIKEFETAYKYLEKHVHYHSINMKNDDEFSQEISRLDIENNYLKEKMQAVKKAANLQYELNKSNTERNTAIYGLIIVLLSSIFFYYLFLLTKRKSKVDKMLIEAQKNENNIIRETELFKSQFLVNISHELKTPLTLINGHVELLEEEPNYAKNDHLLKIKKNGARLLKLINDIINLSKAENGQYQLTYKQGKVLAEIESIVKSFHSQAEIQQIKYTFHSSFTTHSNFNNQFSYSGEVLTIIITNLLSNAFKFTPEGGTITVTAENDKDKLRISIADSGIGIAEKNLEKIFDRFYQEDHLQQRSYDSSGIGLSLVQELSFLHGGEIEVKNQEAGGCIFSVTLTSGKQTSELPISHHQEPLTPSDQLKKVEDKSSNSEENPIVLIVEDQPDLQDFIVSILSENYTCITAKNGEEGIQKAMEYIPDLILSDVMMPLVDGFSFTKQIRNLELTSHIPIILLTAKTDQKDIIQGLSAGSNDYIFKPFSTIELSLKIKNQIAITKKYQEQFSNSDFQKRAELASVHSLNEKDKEFMDKIYASIEKHSTNNQLGVELIAGDLALSSSQLTRKLKSITGLTPGTLIKEVRLETAKEMLSNGHSVADVAYKIGYENPAYFSKVFKEHFGSQPSKFKG